MKDERAEKNEQGVYEMQKRREIMADGRRYIIYYTFGEDREETRENRRENEKGENVWTALESSNGRMGGDGYAPAR